jgi:hypothetical protein
MSTRELVDALVLGDSIAIDNSFNDVISQKISSALDSYKIQVAQSLYPAVQEQDTDANTDEA